MKNKHYNVRHSKNEKKFERIYNVHKLSALGRSLINVD